MTWNSSSAATVVLCVMVVRLVSDALGTETSHYQIRRTWTLQLVATTTRKLLGVHWVLTFGKKSKNFTVTTAYIPFTLPWGFKKILDELKLFFKVWKSKIVNGLDKIGKILIKVWFRKVDVGLSNAINVNVEL